jgi:MFS family permease
MTPAFRRLLASDALMLLALMVGQVAVPWWIAQHGGARHLALQSMIVAATSVVGMPLLSPLGDRHPKRRLIGIALACYALSAAAMALLATLGVYRIEAIVVLVCVNVLAMAVIWPVSSSLMSELVPPAELPRALNLQQGAQATGRLVGPTIGGLLLAAGGTALALWSNCLMLLAAAIFALLLPAQGGAPSGASRDWWRELRAGLRANWAVPLERRWLIVNALSWMFLFPALTMLVPLKVQSLHLSAFWLGLCEAAIALGMLAGSLGLSALAVRCFGRYATRVGAAVLQGLALALAGLTDVPLLMVTCFGLVGLTNAAMALVGLTHRTLARPAAFRARMFAGAAMTAHVAGTIGPMLAGAALTRWPVHAVYAAFGLLAGGTSLMLAFVPGFKAFMALEPDAVEGWYQRVSPQAFGASAEDQSLSP